MLALLTSLALAGSVYVNGVDVGDMRNQTFEDCTVVFDSSGNLHISAPGYEIQVMDTPEPANTAPPAASGFDPRVGQAPAASAPAAVSAPPAPVTAPTPGVAPGVYWLVSDDSGSAGHAVDVYINGNLVSNVTSGQPQAILDLAPWVVPGVNRVHLQATSTNAAGGPLYVYIGQGSNESGTVMMDSPEIQFGLGPSRQGETVRDYTFTAQ